MMNRANCWFRLSGWNRHTAATTQAPNAKKAMISPGTTISANSNTRPTENQINSGLANSRRHSI